MPRDKPAITRDHAGRRPAGCLRGPVSRPASQQRQAEGSLISDISLQDYHRRPSPAAGDEGIPSNAGAEVVTALARFP